MTRGDRLPHSVSVEHEGKIYIATFKVKTGMIIVASDVGDKIVPLDGTPPHVRARILLLDLARGCTRYD